MPSIHEVFGLDGMSNRAAGPQTDQRPIEDFVRRVDHVARPWPTGCPQPLALETAQSFARSMTQREITSCVTCGTELRSLPMRVLDNLLDNLHRRHRTEQHELPLGTAAVDTGDIFKTRRCRGTALSLL